MRLATMKNLREKLTNARELCPGMSKDFYLLTDYMSVTDYMSEYINGEIVPMGIVMLSDYFLEGLNGRNDFGLSLPQELANRRGFVKDEIQWIPQLIDAIAEEEFAAQVRQAWKEIFGSVPPKRVDTTAVDTDTTYPNYVKAAIDWWANAIVSPKFDNGEALSEFFSFFMSRVTKEYTPAEIKTFKETLAKGIMDEMSMHGRCDLDVGYYPCRVLANAGNLIGVNNMYGYPCQTHMSVSVNEVIVRARYGALDEVIWKA